MQKEISVLIVEDEIPTQRLMKDLIERIRPQWNILGATAGVEETVEWLKNNVQPDLIFLDIQLSDGLSFEIFDHVQVTSFIIFTTAYDEYALQAFKVNSIDYLLKPMRLEDLEGAIIKFEKFNSSSYLLEKSEIKALASAVSQGNKSYRTRILVTLIDGYLKLNVNDVAWFHSSQKVTTAYTLQGNPHILDMTLEKLESELDPKKFFRANRQFILNIAAIHRIENWFNGKLVIKAQPESSEKIVVSRERARSFKEWLNQ
ncbi:MAG TPA: LytTR family DNA-binding domain-containing protein [Marinilabiliaceae bacterium]|nr:LytTR family DNA-binding domain-containing protein [Marinilabiliaceae bacterium]